MNTPQIDLSTCTPGQKLRRRDGYIVVFAKLSGDSKYPCETTGGDIYMTDGRYYQSMPSVYDIVEILPLEDGVPKQTATELGLIADNKALQARVQELEGEVNRLVSLDAQNRDNYERCHKALVEKQLCLAQLEWRSVDVKPTREDGNYNGIVCIADGEGNMSTLAYNLWHMLDAKWQWWRPAALPVVKDEERERFNAWYDARCADPSQHKTQLREAMYDAWRAARKEGGV